MSITINIELFAQIIDMVENSDVFDVEIWNRLRADLMTDHGQKKYEVVKKILLSGNEYNPESLFKSCGLVFVGIAACLQALFQFNVEQTKQKLLEWMESENENEGEYLEKAKSVKAVNNVIDGFNNRTAKKNVVSSVRCFTKSYFEEEETQELMLQIKFDDKYE